MREITYLIYIVFWLSLIVGGTGVAVFALGYSGWWWLLSFVLLSTTITPANWNFDVQENETD